MGVSVIPRVNIQNSAVDAASFVATTWIAGGDLNQMFSMLDVETSIATTAILYKVISVNSDGSSPFATISMEGGTSLTVGAGYGWSTFAKASTYINFQFSATTTLKEFWVVERMKW